MPSETELSYCPKIPSFFDGSAINGKSGKRFENVSSVSTRNNLHVIRNMMLVCKPERTLEIGMALGASTLVFTANHRDLGHSPNGQHIAIDPYEEQVWDEAALLAVGDADLSPYLNFRPSPSAMELPALLASGGSFGLI